MPRYGLLCNVDPDEAQTLNDGGDTLCVSIPIGKANPVIASVTDIKESNILSWQNTITVYIVDANQKKSSANDIRFGQTIQVSKGKTTVVDDVNSPRYGFRFITDVGGSLEVDYTFETGDVYIVTTPWYDPGTYDINCDLTFHVWIESMSTNKYDVVYKNSLTEIVYVNGAGEWSTSGPQLYTAGAIVAISKATGGYFFTQPHDAGGSSLQAALDNSSNRLKLSVPVGPLILDGYVDITTLEIGVNLSILGIQLGEIYGNLKDGVVIHVDLKVASGLINLYLKNATQTELWISVNLTIPLMPSASYQVDKKILSW